jgi:N6-L-threonylcarbamoyladenine synthase
MPPPAIVPEVAGGGDGSWIVPTINAAMTEARIGWDDLDAIAVTCGPGLIDVAGRRTAKALAVAHDCPWSP